MEMKKLAIILIILGIIGVLGILSAIPKKDAAGEPPASLDSGATQKKDTGNMSIAAAPAERVEVFLFHRAQRCITCITIGKLSG